ncbi:MAG: prepilin-type N-terminal cleavage/methylation domain-containing protein [Oceanospirillaceae bacterium]|nr:prepilin-type N-terminal cleavage/methylation domain-containing protein [Oceanospirillaceae bacterium]MCP5335886.1 prepilin-type N-terminal cleavage/methylation domain-containing protein [Oceanospirillaceae bacterium]MCP5350360.1 prepilin-type N-terminal cleavage/methylation domain-containing protein [Oceanospirillaceae bacterium]
MKSAGFTLIELIMVIVLISLISALGIGLLPSAQEYKSPLFTDQLLNALRTTQRIALLRENPSDVLSLNVSRDSGEFQLQIMQSGSQLDLIAIEHGGAQLAFTNTDFTTPCASMAASPLPQILYFNGAGDLTNASRVQVSTNLRLCILASPARELCIAPSGYAYAGSCI